ncbi:hypothetical protein [Methylobacterium nigriterrae]|uniref:hypothetical protein n=1 Tax=Methylobacterium nigriterrae TaxID=3127512 RepID=UPI00301357EF
MHLLETPDGRYIVVHGRLWRRHRPDLEPVERDRLVRALIEARRALRAGRRSGNPAAIAAATAAVDAAKRGLGERGPVWWTDSTPDFDRRLIRHTFYAAWYQALSGPEKSMLGRR